MKTSLNLLGISLLFFSSCTNEEQLINIDEAQKIIMSVEDFKFENHSRTTLTPTDDGASFKWSANDTVGIFPETGSQIAFPMTSGAGTNTATFTGGGWALKTSTPYMAYYPMQGKFYLDKENIFVSYLGQTQTENASTAHLGKFDYMVASATTPATDASAVNFQFKHLGALVRLKVTMAETSTLKYVTLQTDNKDFIISGYVNLTETTPSVKSVSDSNNSSSFHISLNDITVEAGQDLIVYFLMPPVNLEDKTLKALIGIDNEYAHEITLTGKNFEAGQPYELAAEIEANYYSDGIAYLSNAGFLSRVISTEELKTISSLQIIGKLNGSDIKTLNSMSALKSLDLSKAQIVSGGSAYGDDWDDDDEHPLYTNNNVIGPQMFWESKLEEVVLPSNITSIGKRAFQDCKRLTSITIPADVTTIGKMAFYNCDELKSVTISGDLEYIGWDCFGYCEKLESINIPNSVTSIGGGAFENCTSLKSINIPSLTVIYEYTFKGTAITTVSIPNTVTKIEEDAFGFCYGLKSVTIPNSVTYLSGFSHCDLSEITIPSSVKTIGPDAFAGNVNLTSITIPDEVTEIGHGAFEYCTGLKGKVIIPNKVTAIGDEAFSNCSGLTSISFGNSVRTIGWNAFRNCTGVRTLTLPSSLQTIKDLAFGGMTLTEVTCLSTTPPSLEGEPFYQSQTNVLYVPIGSKESYLSETKWKSAFTAITELNN